MNMFLTDYHRKALYRLNQLVLRQSEEIAQGKPVKRVDVRAQLLQIAEGNEVLANKLLNEYQAKYGFTDDNTSRGAGYIYFMEAKGFHGIFPGCFLKRCKIGLSIDPQRRLKELNGSQAPCEVLLIRSIPVANMKEAEDKIHDLFAHVNAHNEWFDFKPWGIAQVHSVFDRYESDPKWNPYPGLVLKFWLKKLGKGVVGFVFLFAIAALASSWVNAQLNPTTPTLTEVCTDLKNSGDRCTN